MFSDSRIAYLSNQCEDAILPVVARSIGTWKLGLENILGYHPWYLKKVKPSKESVILDHLLIHNSIPSFDELSILAYGIINIFLKSKKASSLSMIDLFWIRILLLLNCFFLTIITTLLFLLYGNIFYYVIWYVSFDYL